MKFKEFIKTAGEKMDEEFEFDVEQKSANQGSNTNPVDARARVAVAYLNYCAKSGNEFSSWDLNRIIDAIDD